MGGYPELGSLLFDHIVVNLPDGSWAVLTSVALRLGEAKRYTTSLLKVGYG